MKTSFPFLAILIGLPLASLLAQANDGPATRQELQAVRAELVKAINEDRATISTSDRERQEFTVKTSGELVALQETIGALTRQLADANARLAALEQRQKVLQEQFAKQLADLQKLLAEESQQRVDADQRIVSGVSQAVRDVAAQPPPPAPPVDNTPFRVYKVVRGDTLSTIALACGLSIDRLRGFNNLKSDTIYEGQQLKIPEK